MTSINLQTSALYANQSVARARQESLQASNRLSTGLRINSAEDDAGGAAVAARMSSRIASLQRAALNANDGIQMIETADGATQQITDMLQRMRELAIQAANDTYSAAQRADIDIEFQQLKAQLVQVTNGTVWNDQHILDPHQDLLSRFRAAQITSTTAIDTSGPETGTYAMFLNGTQINIDLEDNEAPSVRLNKLVTAINASTPAHGVNASISPSGGLGLITPDGRDLSAWYDSASGGLHAAHLGLGRQEQAQVTRIELSSPDFVSAPPNRTVTSNYVEFAGAGLASESITFVASNHPDPAAGAISIVGTLVYKGDGIEAKPIGSIDPLRNGLNGQPLRIVFKTEYANGNFETGQSGDTSVAGWDIFNAQVRLNGQDTVAGFPTPTDSTPSGIEPNFVNANATFNTNLTNSALPAGSTLGLRMVSSNVSTPSFGVVHGPYIVSQEAVELQSGDTVSFDWKAQGGEDSFDVYAYLLNTETGETRTLLNRTGASTNWTRESLLVPAAGSYKFVFMSGTYDRTGGTIAGAQLFVDNVTVSNANEPYLPVTADMDALEGLVKYNNGLTALNAGLVINGVTVQARESANMTQLATDLYSQIQTKINSGELAHIEVERVGDSLQLTSTEPGLAFNVKKAFSTVETAPIKIVEVQANAVAELLIEGIPNARADSTGVRVIKGAPITEQMIEDVRFKSLHIGDSASENIRFEVPNFGATGTILHELVWDAAIEDQQFANSPLIALMGNIEQKIKVSVRDFSSAQEAIKAIDSALQKTMTARTSLGGLVSRLGHVMDNLLNKGVNTQTSLSQIQDTDYGQEMSQLSRSQLMEQVAMWALKESSSFQRNMLKLLA